MERHTPPALPEPDRRLCYRAYLLRCWGECHGDATVWRFSLEAVSDQTRHGFADLATLLKFLEGVLHDQSNLIRNTTPKQTGGAGSPPA
jgi:hypothetical protein